MQHDLNEMPAGRYELLKDFVYVNIDLIELRRRESVCLESHQSFIDLQIPLFEDEMMGWQSLSKCVNVSQPYNSEKDIAFWNDCYDLFFPLAKGNFVIFFPSDAHAPAIGIGMQKKVVVKIRTIDIIK